MACAAAHIVGVNGSLLSNHRNTGAIELPILRREKMKKFATATVAALSIAATLALSSAPAEARYGRKGAFFGALAAGLVGAAIVGSAARAHHAPVYSDCWSEKRPVYNRWGDFRGYRYIRVCN